MLSVERMHFGAQSLPLPRQTMLPTQRALPPRISIGTPGRELTLRGLLARNLELRATIRGRI
jgi:hypothetical protein